MSKIKALVVLSGGQDSTTCLALAVRMWGADAVAAITFNYGQRHIREIQAATDIAYLAGVTNHEILDLPVGILAGTSPLTDHAQQLEQYDSFEIMDKIIGDRIEKTFVPMRNALFLTVAANRAVVLGANQIWTGVCQADNANYPDCRLQFIDKMEDMIGEALGSSNLSICVPLMNSSKAQSIRMLLEYGPTAFALLGHSHTAYDGQFPPVGQDHATVLRAQGFLESRWPDPLVLRAHHLGLMDLPKTENYQEPMVNAGVIQMVMENDAKLAERDLLAKQQREKALDEIMSKPLEQGDHQ